MRVFDPVAGSGTVLLDDGTEIPFDGAAFAAGGLRTARLGQRVRIHTAGDAEQRRVVFLTIATLPVRPAELDFPAGRSNPAEPAP